MIASYWSGRVNRREYIIGAMGVYGFWLTTGASAAHLGAYLGHENVVGWVYFVVSAAFALAASRLLARRARDAAWPVKILLGAFWISVAPLQLALAGVRRLEMAAIWGIAAIVMIAFALCFPKPR